MISGLTQTFIKMSFMKDKDKYKKTISFSRGIKKKRWSIFESRSMKTT